MQAVFQLFYNYSDGYVFFYPKKKKESVVTDW
jgi:hypothetical protein